MGWSVIIREKLPPAQIKERAAVFEKQDTYIQHQHYTISGIKPRNKETLSNKIIDLACASYN